MSCRLGRQTVVYLTSDRARPPRPLPLSPRLPCPALPAGKPAGRAGRKGTLPGCFRPEKFRSGSRRGCCQQSDARCISPGAATLTPPAGSRRRPGAEAVSTMPGRFCATVARRSETRLLVFRCIFFNATSLFQLVAGRRIRFPMLFAFPILWRIKIFVFLQSVPGRLN